MAARKHLRFRRPEFQEKLARARKFQRRASAQAVLGSGFTKAVVGLLILNILYFLGISQVFLVKDAILLPEGINSDEVNDVLKRLGEKRKAYFVPANHLFILSRENFLSAIQQDLPRVRSITHFRRILPNKVEVELEEREPRYVWRAADNYYLMDQDGVIFQKLQNYIPETYSQVLITDKTGEAVTVGTSLAAGKILRFIEQLKELWPKQVSETNFVRLAVPGTKALDIFVKTAIGFEVYFDLERSVERQLANLNFVLNQEIKSETYSGLSYIDLRLPNVGYYCYKDASCAPENESGITN